MFQVNKRSLIASFILAFLFFIVVTAKLPYYIYKPGAADELTDMVEVNHGYDSEGAFHLVTVSGGRATPLEYIWAKFASYREILPLEEAIPEGFTDEAYRFFQLKMMEDSKAASKVVAYEAAGKKVDIIFNGVYVLQTIPHMPAEEVLEVGDRIFAVDGREVKEAKDLTSYVEKKNVKDIVSLTIERDERIEEIDVMIDNFPEGNGNRGIGIQLLAEKSVHVEPKVNIKSGNIGGPSAGLMFALEMHNQLVEEDITKGYRIAGTGELAFDGSVLRVGGVDKKVIAANRKGVDIFFAPYEAGAKESNYEVAKQTADEINADMEIVPIDSFDEALDYLNQLEPND